jgi:hypothetical protein
MPYSALVMGRSSSTNTDCGHITRVPVSEGLVVFVGERCVCACVRVGQGHHHKAQGAKVGQGRVG